MQKVRCVCSGSKSGLVLGLCACGGQQSRLLLFCEGLRLFKRFEEQVINGEQFNGSVLSLKGKARNANEEFEEVCHAP